MASVERSEEQKKKVVVIGGGVGGSFLAYNIQHCADVVLIDQKEYFEVPWANLRSMVDPSFAARSVINHIDYLTKVKIIVSSAVNITETEVLTADGQTFAYDYLVVATGHEESVPKTRTERLSWYQAEFEKISSANSVLIVGGGPTGVELASEIAYDFPNKKVKLVHRGPRLLEYISTRASEKALEWLTSKKVEVILDQSINLKSMQDGAIQTSAGVTIHADCHFICTGKPMGSSWLRSTVLKDRMDICGRLMVDENLRVRGFKKVFAIGDITDINELKVGYLVQKHAIMTAKNLKMLMMGRNESKMATYKPGFPFAVVSLGRKEALAHLPLFTLIGCIPGMIKSRDLFVGKTRKQLGLKPNLE
ncbi:hypothetical protein Q3G72_025000 [Acer saccharum]|nr:hypothetical protein Q3G72_025000 [Acer saccharum]